MTRHNPPFTSKQARARLRFVLGGDGVGAAWVVWKLNVDYLAA